MKTFKFLLIALSLCISAGAGAQTYCFSSPQGYGEDATGGGSGDVTIVTSRSELKSALTASGKGIVIVKGTVECDYLSVEVTDKTLLGLSGAKLYTDDQSDGESGILHLKPGSDNVIIRNLIFEGPGAYDSDGRDCLTNQATNLWVDHCEFRDGMDGNFDNKGDADDVTVSWCKFTYLKDPKSGGSGGTDDHRYSNLVGSSNSDYPDDGSYNITWQYCWWADGCVERMVRARNATLHQVNCYWSSDDTKTAIGLSDGNKGCSDYVENGVFDCSGTICKTSYGGSPSVKFVNCTNGGDNEGSVSQPSYSYEVISASSVVSAVTNSSCGAGATLTVTTSGKVSASCGDDDDDDDDDDGDASVSLSTSSGDGYVKLSWSTSNIDVSSFQIYRDTDSDLDGRVRIATVGSSTSSYTDEDISNGTTYYYSLKVTDSDGNVTNSDAVKATPSGDDDDDSDGTASITLTTSGEDESVSLSWSTSNIDVKSFQVYRDTDSELSGRVRIASVSSSTTTYTDEDVTNGTTYYYSIKVTDTDGDVTNSVAVGATPSSSAVATLTTSAGNGYVNLYWSTTNIDVKSFQIYRDTDSDLDGRVRISSESSSTVTYTDEDVTNGTTYYYSIKVTDTDGDVTNTDAVEATPSSTSSSSISSTTLKDATRSNSISATNSEQVLKLYPNPASSSVTVELNEALAEGALIQVFDVSGSLVKSKNVNGEKQTLDISDLQSGSYIIQVSNSKESIMNHIVKQ